MVRRRVVVVLVCGLLETEVVVRFVAGDQLLKGAALNAVQIAEVMVQKGMLKKAVVS